MLAAHSIQFLWDADKTRKLFKTHLILFFIGATVGIIYSFFLPKTTPYYSIIVSVPVLFFLSCFLYFYLINKINPWWLFLIFCLQSQVACAMFMALTGGFLGIVQFAPYAFLIFAVFELGSDAAVILGIFSIFTFLGIFYWALLTNPSTTTVLLEFFYYMASYILILILERNLGNELSLQLEARKKMEEVDDLKNQFITLSSHYLRTPVTEIKGYLHQVNTTDLGQNQAINSALQGTQKLELIIDKLLTLSSIEKGALKVLKTPIDLDLLIKQILEDYLTKAKSLNIRVSYKNNLQTTSILNGDRNQLKTALSSIIDNAIIFNKKGGLVEIVLNFQEKEFKIICNDTGEGIPQAKMDTLFTPFNKGGMENVLNLENPGMGLSLYLSKLIIEGHGGSIDLKSEIQKGTRVTIFLPISNTTFS